MADDETDDPEAGGQLHDRLDSTMVEAEHRRLWTIVKAIVWLVAVATLVAIGFHHFHDSSHPKNLGGVVSVVRSSPPGSLGSTAPGQANGSTCVTNAGYDDITEGGSVTVINENGKVIALGTLDSGYVAADASTGVSYCTFRFSVDNLPNAQFYGIAIGHRNTLRYSVGDLQASDYKVTMTLGGN